MIDTPRILATPAQRTAMIHIVVPRSEIQSVMGPAISEVLETVAAQAVGPAGVWFTHHLRIDPEMFDLEVHVPVHAPVEASGRVTPGERRAATVAASIYQGPYEGLGDAWGELMDWMSLHDHEPAPDLWESYLVGPDSGLDASAWRTQLHRPLA